MGCGSCIIDDCGGNVLFEANSRSVAQNGPNVGCGLLFGRESAEHVAVFGVLVLCVARQGGIQRRSIGKQCVSWLEVRVICSKRAAPW